MQALCRAFRARDGEDGAGVRLPSIFRPRGLNNLAILRSHVSMASTSSRSCGALSDYFSLLEHYSQGSVDHNPEAPEIVVLAEHGILAFTTQLIANFHEKKAGLLPREDPLDDVVQSMFTWRQCHPCRFHENNFVICTRRDLGSMTRIYCNVESLTSRLL